ncbi:unnamed protein product [Durusdinium trenchii]|uniref:Calmodulin n=1 Tax=Durusdinium trenchii TaxID=1381693 RepID=A0ABP0JV58_9DINO
MKGDATELLELLFCLFDADQDDLVGLTDLEHTIDAFLQLPEALQLPEPDAKDFRTLDARKRNGEVTLMAKKALQDFALDESDPEPEEDLAEDRGSDQKCVIR